MLTDMGRWGALGVLWGRGSLRRKSVFLPAVWAVECFVFFAAALGARGTTLLAAARPTTAGEPDD